MGGAPLLRWSTTVHNPKLTQADRDEFRRDLDQLPRRVSIRDKIDVTLRLRFLDIATAIAEGRGNLIRANPNSPAAKIPQRRIRME